MGWMWTVRGAMAGALLGMGTAAAAQVSADPEVRLGFYVQVEAEYSSLGSPENGRVVMGIHRARPRLELIVNERLRGRLEPDFGGGRARLVYATVDLDVGENTTLRFGQFKKPFGLIENTSSSLIPVIQRGTEISGLAERVSALGSPVALPDGRTLIADEQTILAELGYQGLGLGAALMGRAGQLEYSAGVFEGPTGGADDVRRGGIAGRAAWSFFPGVALGAGLSHSRLTFDDVERDGTAGSLDFTFGFPGGPGIGLLAEAVAGRGVGTGTDFAGGHALAWLHRAMDGRFSGIEPLVRVSWLDPDRDADDDSGLLLTAGLNLYLGDRNRLMLDWDVYRAADDRIGTESALRAQAQLRF